jgi:hypothetical protein
MGWGALGASSLGAPLCAAGAVLGARWFLSSNLIREYPDSPSEPVSLGPTLAMVAGHIKSYDTKEVRVIFGEPMLNVVVGRGAVAVATLLQPSRA